MKERESEIELSAPFYTFSSRLLIELQISKGQTEE